MHVCITWPQWVNSSPPPPTRRQAIIWTNDGLGYRRIYASLGLNELMKINEWVLAESYWLKCILEATRTWHYVQWGHDFMCDLWPDLKCFKKFGKVCRIFNNKSKGALEQVLLFSNLSLHDSLFPHQHTGARTKGPPFCRQHFQLHFLEWKVAYSRNPL